ncbi:putative thiosulfate sulfurtransferase [Parachaetomium inaequale]|uniref:Thiosulfate sulfurtransferase n=1 Tax=Parachaetomium inaequale TaxID=2588326 RepID=A0AAN6SRS5_9PEZI|nr:putative thiosulfate sulfurtransferase [Parachaetomium inaequale]
MPLACLLFIPTLSPWWLNKCKPHLDLAVIDLCSAVEYAESHIPGSFSLPFEPISAWSQMGPGDLLLEMSPSPNIFATLTSISVSNPNPATKIVLVNGVGVPAFPQVPPPGGVATALKHAGIAEGCIYALDGGFPGWTRNNLPTTTTLPTPVPRTYTATEDRSFLVNISYVAANLDKKDQGIFLADGREETVYNGSVLEEWALKPGHIPSAVSLPARHIWAANGSWRRFLELLAVGYGASCSSGRLIVCCGVGGYASSWYFVLTRILGFDNVVMYDGSAQEWSQYCDMEL